MKIAVGHRFPMLEVTPFRLLWVVIVAAISWYFFGAWVMIPILLASLYLGD